LVQHAIKDGCKWSTGGRNDFEKLTSHNMLKQCLGDQIPQRESGNSCSWMAVIFTVTELLNLCQDEVNAPICFVIILKNNENLEE
jgi:hypothetical protein